MSKLPLPDANAPMVDPKTGAPTQVWYRMQKAISDKIFGAETDLGALPGKFETEFGSWFIEFPDDKDYRLIVNIPYGITITSVTTKADTGTCTATVKIGSTALGGAANSVSTSEVTEEHEEDNEMEAGDDLVLTISSNSGCEGMTITIAGTRTIS